MIFLAPMQGYTDYYFRNVYSRHYSGIDAAVSPFISLITGDKGKPRIAKDVLPANNHTMPVIPQILGNNPTQFIEMAKFLHGWEYDKINWNLGCPMRQITRKKRGSGLLPHPELIREMLEKIIPNIPQIVSVKIRLGLKRPDEIYHLIPVLNDFPLEYVIIHPRIGAQMYEGEVHHNVMIDCLPLLKHEIVYNGDIFSREDFMTFKARYPTIKKWMIGRGVFYNPLLSMLIKGNELPSQVNIREQFSSFIFDMYNDLQSDPHIHSVENKVKMLWQLFSKRFVNDVGIFKQIAHSISMDEIIRITRKVMEKEELR